MQLPEVIHPKIPRKLSVELVPKSVRSNNLFYYYNQNRKLDLWSGIKNELLEREGQHCWICQKKSVQLHLHEFWAFDDTNQRMILQELHHVCNLCDKVLNANLWFLTDYGREQLLKLDILPEDLIKHYCKVNSCSLKDFGKDWRSAVDTWKKRNEITWEVNFGIYNPD
ncbi:MAG: hypothetical protein FK733_16485 [Asgard group archaeon]|nr:hypothetical protein [Asgard group archaeon]